MTGDPCPSGTYQYSSGKSFCDLCDIGKASSGNAIQCQSCDRGTHAANTNSSQCTSCPSGRAQPNVSHHHHHIHVVYGVIRKLIVIQIGQASCVDCAPGRAVSAAQQLSCIDCPRGEYAKTNGMANCEQCPPGIFCFRFMSTRICSLTWSLCRYLY
jgi:hypothetical protein